MKIVDNETLAILENGDVDEPRQGTIVLLIDSILRLKEALLITQQWMLKGPALESERAAWRNHMARIRELVGDA